MIGEFLTLFFSKNICISLFEILNFQEIDIQKLENGRSRGNLSKSLKFKNIMP